MSRLSRGNGLSPNFVSSPTGSALLFGVTFVVVWFVVSFLAVLARMLLRRVG
jgi:threonine/homoserine/homoserine lactone efflux protein